MQLGLDRLPDYLVTNVRGARIGLVCHAASLTSTGRTAVDVCARAPVTLTALFGPEHGIHGAAADMASVGEVMHPTLRIPVYSLYGDSVASLSPRPEWFHGLDLLVIDLQDIGTRYYTYANTMANCLRVCNDIRLPVIVCDRPNPINGVTVEGPVVDLGFHSFVGQYSIPVRHGMTIGELAQCIRVRERWDAPVTILPMQGWQRPWHWDDTGLTWHNPSPNIRSLAAALLYPGTCLLEATNISEGRGTATPFEHCGAPWIDGPTLATVLQAMHLPGIECTSTQFIPTARKFAGRTCGGVAFTITDRQGFHPYRFGLALLWALASHDRQSFHWRTPTGNPPHTGLDAGPYEFVTDRPAIDLLTGGTSVRAAIDAGATWPELTARAGPTPAEFLALRTESLLY